MSRVLVLGASGMMGHKLCQILPPRGHEVFATVRNPQMRLASLFPSVRLTEGVDVLENESVVRIMRESRPEFVVNCVGIVKQLKAASDKALSVAVNAWFPHRLGVICRETGAFLIHLSTDCVFDGTRGSYSESDASDARDLYGKSKYLGEHDSEESGAVTLRTSIIGRELRKPTHGLVEWFLSHKGGIVKGFVHAIYTGFTTIEMARILARVIETRPQIQGTVQVASSAISKCDLLQLMRQSFGIDISIERDEHYACDRSLLMGRFADITGYRAPSWSQMVWEMSKDPTPYDDIQRGDSTCS